MCWLPKTFIMVYCLTQAMIASPLCNTTGHCSAGHELPPRGYFSIKPGSFGLEQLGGGSFQVWYSTQLFLLFIELKPRRNINHRYTYIHGIRQPSINLQKKHKRKRDSLALNSFGLENDSFLSFLNCTVGGSSRAGLAFQQAM